MRAEQQLREAMRAAAARRLQENRAKPAGTPELEGKSKACQNCSCSAATKAAHAAARGE